MTDDERKTYPRITVASTRAAIEATGYALVRQAFLDDRHKHACAAGLHYLAIGEAAFLGIPNEYIYGVEAGFERWHREVFGPVDYQIGYRDGAAIREAFRPPLGEEWLSARVEEPRPVSGEHEPGRLCACGHRTWQEFPSPLQTEVAP